MGRACNTNVARSMGFLSSPSIEEIQYHDPRVATGTGSGIVSYHQGLSSKDEFMNRVREQRRAKEALCKRNEWRL